MILRPRQMVQPELCQTTMSVFSTERLLAVHAGRPSPPVDWLTNSPAGKRSSGAKRVTHS